MSSGLAATVGTLVDVDAIDLCNVDAGGLQVLSQWHFLIRLTVGLLQAGQLRNALAPIDVDGLEQRKRQRR